MGTNTNTCSVCGASFNLRFSYQIQKTNEQVLYFCSQKCHEKHLYSRSLKNCSVCNTEFPLIYAYQQLVIKDQRLFFCSSDCRTKALERAAAPAAEETIDNAPKAHRIAVLNQKGGTGKTTTSVSLASGLATMGYRTLLMDLDAQGNVGVSLGVSGTKSLYHVLMGISTPQEASIKFSDRLDILPANETLASAEIRLAQMQQGRDRVLAQRMSGIKSYDYVILDCGPSLNLMNQNALTFADQVLIPVSCDYLSLVGVKQILKTLRMVNDILKHPITILGVLPTFYDQRNKISREAINTLKTFFEDKVLPPIRINTKLKEAPSHQKTIHDYAPDSRGAEDYMRLVKWLVARNSGVSKDPWADCSTDADADTDTETDIDIDVTAADDDGDRDNGELGAGRVKNKYINNESSDHKGQHGRKTTMTQKSKMGGSDSAHQSGW